MPASAILSAPMPLAGAASLPPPEAGTAPPLAAIAFGALVDARTAPAAQTLPAALPADPSLTPVAASGVIQPAELPVAMAGTGGIVSPVIEAPTDISTLPPMNEAGVEGEPAAPLPDQPPAPATPPVAEAETPPSEPPVQPSAGQTAPPASLRPSAAAVSPPDDAPPLQKDPVDEAGAETDEVEIVAQPVAATPQSPIPLVSSIPPATRPALAASAQPDADAPEAIPETKRLKAAKQAPPASNGPVSGGKEAPASDVARPATQSAAAAADVPATADQPDGGLPSPLLTQTMAPVTSRPSAAVYPQAAQPTTHAPVVQAQPGRIGADIGVEIARAAKGDREDLLIRLDPRDMGRINVRLSFDGDGVLRAVMSADSPGALEMLRRESGELNRALADAGIRSDAQSLRFDARSGDQGQGGSQSGQRGQHAQTGGSHRAAGDGAAELAEPHYRPLRSSGQVDLMA